MQQALSSLRILDFSTLIPGPFATMVLADLGADVIRVEDPHRTDLLREVPPLVGGVSAWHGVLGRSKRSLCLDLKNDAALQVLRRLVDSHDIVVEQFRPGVMERLGVGYGALREVNPAIIYCSITSFGTTGPLRDHAAHDVNALALAGVLGIGGDRSAANPHPPGIQVADLAVGMNVVAGILAAVVHRRETGEGQRIEVSLFQTAHMWNLLAASEYLAGEQEPGPGTNLLNGGSRYGVYETSDGRHLAVGSLEAHLWSRFCDAIGRPDLDKEMGPDSDRGAHASPSAPELRAEVARIIGQRTLTEWLEVLEGLDAGVHPVLHVPGALAHPQAEALGVVVDVGRGPEAQRQIGNAIRLQGTPATYRHTGVAPGAQRDEILAELGYSATEIEDLERRGIFGGHEAESARRQH